ncbi:hypothetical protein RB195_009614 [Necator americanus]|nr:hypothetical protein NECAME_15974 [Necator americanus]ETN68178.1 hypothetical protein NECAME_15974 [Necator americanus]
MSKMISKLAASQNRNSDEKSPKPKKEKPLHVVKIKRIPYGLFEKQLWEYFTQFGKVIRVRVARSLKTGNHKGWAYVGFADKEVAEIAAESMDGYLMFEKRLSCHVMDPKKVPKSMKRGPRYLAPPHMKGRAKKEALKRNRKKTSEEEEKSKKRREAAQRKRYNKLKVLGIDYEFGSMSSSTSTEAKSTVKADVGKQEENESDHPDASTSQVKTRKPAKALKSLKMKAANARNKVLASKVKRVRK